MDNQLFLLLTARKLSGEASEADEKELEKFFNEDDLFRKKFELLKAHWENKNRIPTNIDAALQKILLQIQNDINESEEIQLFSTPDKKSGVIKLLIQFSKVAAILVVCIVGAYLFYKKAAAPGSPAKVAFKEALQIRQTPKGEMSTIVLSDGTKVIMNANTSLKFPQKFGGATREVYLTGEAFFDVAHNANMPFIIHTDKMSIKVLGTEFNVKSYPEDSTTETTLIRGLIEVTLNNRPDDRIILKPKEKLIVSGMAATKSPAEIKETATTHSAEILISNLHYISRSDSAVAETAWVDNKLVFQDESFGNLAADIGRKYDVDVQFNNETVKDYRFTGVFEKETLTEALSALQLTEKFNYKIEGTNVIIY